MIADLTNGDIAVDSYNRYHEDVENLIALGVDFYRFSLSWARILPTGRADYINPDGIRYYNELLDLLAANNIEPLVCFNQLFVYVLGILAIHLDFVWKSLKFSDFFYYNMHESYI